MEAFALYLFKSVVWLTGFALVYLLFLRNERYFLLNRIYLVAGMVASILFPFLTWHYTIVIPFTPSVEVSDLQVTGIVNEPEPFPAKEILLILYMAGSIYLLYRIIRQTITVIGVIRHAEILPYRSAKLIRTNAYPSSFSFFSFVFVNPSNSDIETSEIVNHEMEHVRQRHWIDLLLFELLCTLQWLNPMVWLYGRFIRQNHEFLADQCALQRTQNPAIYRAALINQLFGAEVISLANSFNYSINKKRFHMMKNTIQSPIRKLKLLIILPIIAGVFYAFATPEYKYPQADVTAMPQSEKTVTGKVINDKGNPLKGAAIIISGTNIGTITDDNGVFILKITDSSPIVISHVGFDSQKLTPDTEYQMIITLKPVNIGIDEVTVTGLGNSSDITTIKGNFSTITSTNTNTASGINFNAKNIQGISRNGTDVLKGENIAIDMGNTNSLVYINGNESTNTEANKLNPEDIESISVFKNESATINFGDKGKNGVILINLKNENKTQKKQIYTGMTFRCSDGSTITEPLIVIDGKISDSQTFMNMPQENILTMSALNTESAISKYGDKGKNGVVEVITKKEQSEYKNIKSFTTSDGHHYTKIGEPLQPQKDTKVFTMVEEMPEFPGGDAALRKFLAENVKYPIEAQEKGAQGKVYVMFVVTKKGAVANAKIVRGVDPSLDQEALRVVNLLPQWKPGKQGGKDVDVEYTVPINFVLEGKPEAKGGQDPYTVVEQMPEYPGGVDALKEFIATNIKYPVIAAQEGIQGKVFVTFVVTKTGQVTNVKIARSVDSSIDQEAMRVVQSMPTWIPGKQNGETVDVVYTIPINFVLPEKKISEEKLRISENTSDQQNVQQAGKLVIVPNPTNNRATVTLEGSDSTNQLQVSVIDSYGKMVKQETKNGPSFTLSVSSLTPGTYRVIAVDGSKQYQGSLVVNR